MSADLKPIFRPEALRPKLLAFDLPAHVAGVRPKIAAWAALLADAGGAARKETELLADFIRDVFVDLLGYVPPPAPAYSLKKEALVNGCGVFVEAELKSLYQKDGFRVEVSTGGANGVFAYGCNYWHGTVGYGKAPSVSGELFESRDAARTAGIDFLLERLP